MMQGMQAIELQMKTVPDMCVSVDADNRHVSSSGVRFSAPIITCRIP